MSRSRVFSSLAFALLVLPCVACGGPDPENPGDECDPDDGCPDDMVCSNEICQLKPGRECEVGKDYCLDAAVCGADGDGAGTCGTPKGAACEVDATPCAGNMSCAETPEGHSCQWPVLVQGEVFDAESTLPIKDAHIVALDDSATALTDIAISDAAGNYTLDLPVPRDAAGVPVGSVLVTLRASARDYQTFPGGLRTALPIQSSSAAPQGEAYVIESALTSIALIGLPDDQRGRASIAGTVKADDKSGGVLVVAETTPLPTDGSTAPSAVSDRHGKYTIFNVGDGAQTVRGYAAGLQLIPVDTTVAGANLSGIDLLLSDAALGSIAGRVEIVNAFGGAMTSIVLVPTSTFSETFVRGEVPRGLRTPLTGAPNVSGDFMIVDVPAGHYTVLAAFENDELVRDPDINIAGTQIVSQEMPSPGQAIVLAQSFKVTEALDVINPGKDAPQAVSAGGALTLTWEDDSGEEWYEVVVYNALGELVWCRADRMTECGPNVPSVSGNTQVSVAYDGPLESGMYYQFRASSMRSTTRGPSALSQTEDLRGVFFVE